MICFFRKRRLNFYASRISEYIQQNYIDSCQPSELQCSQNEDTASEQQKKTESGESYADLQSGGSDIALIVREQLRYSSRDVDTPSQGVKYSSRGTPASKDPFDATEVTRLLRNYSAKGNLNEIQKALDNSINQTFVDRLLYYINKKGLRDSELYKAAQVDKRLFSKMVSNREYKPSKDTAIALALALELSLDEAKEMLSRAGYTFSHSNKRDIIVEFFFREKVYNLMDANDLLYSLNQKIIGRS